MMTLLFWVLLFLFGIPSSIPPQGQAAPPIDPAKIPATALVTTDFVPKGWMIEEQVTGDLNKDGQDDIALKLVEKFPSDADQDNPPERARALLILLKLPDGRMQKAAFTAKLLQCTRCGGAFYGSIEAPAEVKIEKGILIVRQDYGSREMTEETWRFRLDPATNRFLLIGMDLRTTDRATGQTVEESTNYLTNLKLTTRYQYDQKQDREVALAPKREKIAPAKQYLENIDRTNR